MKRRPSRLLPPTFIILLFFFFSGCDTDPATGPGDDDPPPSEAYSHTQNPGTANEDLISDREFHTLIVQTQYMEGYAPTSDALESLEEFLNEHLDKATIIVEEPEEIEAAGQETYTASEVRDLEEQHRTLFSNREEGELAIYNLFLDGEFADANVLGIAYYNTSSGLFGETIQDVSSGIGSPDRWLVEATVLRHEVGHLMGLVDSGTDMQQEHHDDANEAHCTEEECLMYYAFRSPDLITNLLGATAPDLDAYCREDVEAVRE